MPPSAVTVSRESVPLKILTIEPDSAVPLTSGVVSFVRSSVSEEPESDAAFRSRDGADTVVSIVTTSLVLLPDVFPAVSVVFAVNVKEPSENASVI